MGKWLVDNLGVTDWVVAKHIPETFNERRAHLLQDGVFPSLEALQAHGSSDAGGAINCYYLPLCSLRLLAQWKVWKRQLIVDCTTKKPLLTKKWPHFSRGYRDTCIRFLTMSQVVRTNQYSV